MSAANTIFDSYSRPHSLDFSDSMLAFPTFGNLLARIQTALGNWAQAAIQEQSDSSLRQAAPAMGRIPVEMAQAAVATPSPVPDRAPLNTGWSRILENAYPMRAHGNAALPA